GGSDYVRLVGHRRREEGSTRGRRYPGRHDSDRGRPARRRSIRRSAVRLRVWLAGAIAALALAPSALAVENTDWLSYGHDNQLTNATPSTALTSKSAPRLARTWISKLAGAVYASPLATVVDGRELLYAFTENGSVYALAASTGMIVWQRELGTVATADCGTWGITSTGA